jgi:DNA-binding NarL/FixJ family response regulator
MTKQISNADQDMATDSKSDLQGPIAIFIGSAIRFSDRMLAAFRLEFPDIAFLRVPAVSDLAVARRLHPDVVLAIIGDDAIQPLLDRPAVYLDAAGPARLVIAYTEHAATADFVAQRTVMDGLQDVGFLPLNAQIEVWMSMMQLLLCGRNFLPQELLTPHAVPHVNPGVATADGTVLTPREVEVLSLVAEGMQNKNIAVSLDLSEHTVKLHIHNVLKKIGASNRTSAANWFMTAAERLGAPVRPASQGSHA